MPSPPPVPEPPFVVIKEDEPVTSKAWFGAVMAVVAIAALGIPGYLWVTKVFIPAEEAKRVAPEPLLALEAPPVPQLAAAVAPAPAKTVDEAPLALPEPSPRLESNNI
jgi:hypothetical protein